MVDLLNWLQKIYHEDFCNGSWEHVHGVTIDTLDPGWDFKFDLRETDLENMDFKGVFIKKDDENWFQCWKEEGIFHSWGGSQNLSNIIDIFREWYTKTTILLDRNNEST